jgi:hypothetical protein
LSHFEPLRVRPERRLPADWSLPGHCPVIYRRSSADATATSGAGLEDLLDLRAHRPGRRPRRWRYQTPPT